MRARAQNKLVQGYLSLLYIMKRLKQRKKQILNCTEDLQLQNGEEFIKRLNTDVLLVTLFTFLVTIKKKIK